MLKKLDWLLILVRIYPYSPKECKTFPPCYFWQYLKESNTNLSQTNVISPNKKECISGGVVQATLSFRFTLQSNSPLFLAGGDLWLLWFTFDVSVYDHVAVQIVDSL